MVTNPCMEWATDFKKFTETGESSAGFLSHLDECENCQPAVEEVFDAQAEGFQELHKRIKGIS